MDKTLIKLYYSISEVSRLSGVKSHVLRYWEEEFSILRPQKNRAGNRTYRPRDVKIVLVLKRLLQEEKYSIKGAKEKLKNDKEFVRQQLEQSSDEIESKHILLELKEELTELLQLVNQL